MKRKIIFLTDNLFYNRDYVRFGFRYLKKFFQIEVINVSNITKPSFIKNIKEKNFRFKNVNYFNNLDELKKYISNSRFDYSYDFLGVDSKSWKIRKILVKENIKFLKIFNDDQTVLNLNKKSFLKRILEIFNNKKKKLGFFKKINNRINIFLNKDFIWDYGIFHNSHAFNKNNKKNCKKYIKTNSFDFDTFILNKYKKNLKFKNYFVFIDNSISNHPDYSYHGATLDIDDKKYYNDHKLFFDHFEKENNTKIIIAGSPKIKYNNNKIFGNRVIKYQLTSLLIKNSRGVLIHNSSAVNFAVLYRKPIIFLTTNEISKTWFGYYNDILSNFFKQKIININSYKRADLKMLKININIFKRYQNMFITCSKNNKLSWEIIKKGLN
jgi:hypothetical protein